MSKTFILRDELVLTSDQVNSIFEPKRGGLVSEIEIPDSPGCFSMKRGIVSNYCREVDFEPNADSATFVVRQSVHYKVDLFGFGSLVGRALRTRLRDINPEVEIPIWLPPDILDNSVARSLVRLLMISISTAYFATLLGQTLTFSAHEFHANLRDQTLVLLLSRFDIVFGLLLLVFVRRRGRVRIIQIGTVLGTFFSLLSTVAPNMATLGILQVLAKGSTAAIGVLITVSVAETVSPRQRAWGIGLMVFGAAIGAGLCDVLLPIAGFTDWSWRILYAVSLPLGIYGMVLSSGLTDTERFQALKTASVNLSKTISVPMTTRARMAVLAVASFVTNAFLIPTTQFRNEYLRVERHLSAAEIGMFVILTNVPGVLGLVFGGRLAETKGRKVVGVVAIIVGGGGIAMGFISAGLGLWVWTIVGSAVIPAIVPSLGVYQTELFSTQSRSMGGGLVTVGARIGSIVGVALVGYWASFYSLGSSIAFLFVGMIFLVPILIAFFPETKGLSLEDIS